MRGLQPVATEPWENHGKTCCSIYTQQILGQQLSRFHVPASIQFVGSSVCLLVGAGCHLNNDSHNKHKHATVTATNKRTTTATSGDTRINSSNIWDIFKLYNTINSNSEGIPDPNPASTQGNREGSSLLLEPIEQHSLQLVTQQCCKGNQRM